MSKGGIKKGEKRGKKRGKGKKRRERVNEYLIGPLLLVVAGPTFLAVKQRHVFFELLVLLAFLFLCLVCSSWLWKMYLQGIAKGSYTVNIYHIISTVIINNDTRCRNK
jgi:hypothetical protein